ncbi:glycosyltransferase family 2 protein (plasmid) [Halolamina sp. CBA1230]|uniref:glycosyltransferase family 2 protein n=1 Tax=Halolamina sp. CBA1230 TaxID=1853690 RepID=UPI0009A19DA6|nr:glycosyltransferase family 2 protein [Halolamina sp. CBA1230]QKY21986.1 glycosyltransferase family 2 protein [Halolamina sp. CBA1230]
MYRGHTTAVVIPAYNEEGFVGDTIASVPGFVDRVYAVDDGSTDGTWTEIRAAADTIAAADGTTPDDARVVAIQHERNRGVGGAIKTGYQHARADRIDLTAVMGGDGQMEPEMLGDLFDPIVDGDADYTKGNRFLDRSGRGSMPAHRFVGNAVLGALTKIASGYWRCGDPQSGYTAISLRALETAAIDEMYEFYGYCNDLLVKLNVARLRVVDVPRPITYGEEESHIQYRSYVPRVSLMLLRNFLWRLKTNYLAYDFHPLVGAYAAGGVASIASVAAAVWALPGVGTAATPTARGALALGFGLFALVAVTWAMAMDRSANDHLDGTVTPADRRRPTEDHGQPSRNGASPSDAQRDEDAADGNGAADSAAQAPPPEEYGGPNTASD